MMLNTVRVRLAFAFAAVLSARAFAATGDPVLINEVLASHTGTDDSEFVELFGTPDAALAGLSLIVVEGDEFGPGTIDRRLDFDASHVLGANGFFLIGNPVGLGENYGVVPNIPVADNYLENSSLTVALVDTASLTGGSVSGGEIVRDAVALTDGGAADVFYFSAPVIGPDGTFFPAGARRLVDGVDTDSVSDWAISDFNLGPANSPVGGEASPPPPPTEASIMEIQGTGQFSPLAGERVETWGVVTLFTANGRFFWIQDPDGDGEPATSDGIFVNAGGFGGARSEPAVGDFVRVVAEVEEQQFGNALPLTRLTRVESVEILSTGYSLPAPVPLIGLPGESIAAAIDLWEPLEGMRVQVVDAPVVAATNGFGEFAMLARRDAKPGSGYEPRNKQILLRKLGPDAVDYNPERVLVDDSSLGEAITVRPGDTIEQLTGVVDYTFGNYKLQPVTWSVEYGAAYDWPVSRRSGPPGDLVITTFNVENLFDLVDEPGKDDADSTPSTAELETKLAKLALAVVHEAELPAILVVQEVENTAILQTLGDRVNLATGTGYRAESFETSDARGIEVGFLYDADRVELVEAFQLTGPDVEAAFGPDSASPGREPLVGRFRFGDAEITIVGNHFKSKGGDDPLFGVNDPPLRVTEAQRKLQARVVRDYVNTIVDADGEAKVVVLGDLNDFQFGEPGEGSDHPLAILEGSADEVPLTSLIAWEKPAERFTFVFDGNSQVLDHVLVSPALLESLEAVDFLHFNAGYPAHLESDPSTPIRSSDHDPIEARFGFYEVVRLVGQEIGK